MTLEQALLNFVDELARIVHAINEASFILLPEIDF